MQYHCSMLSFFLFSQSDIKAARIMTSSHNTGTSLHLQPSAQQCRLQWHFQEKTWTLSKLGLVGSCFRAEESMRFDELKYYLLSC